MWRLAARRAVRRSLATLGAGVSGAALAWLLWRWAVWEETGGFPTDGLMPVCDAASCVIGYGWSAGIACVVGELLALVVPPRPNDPDHLPHDTLGGFR
ncbi:hypothetical protein [Zavarzinella formosa]|uniref:hypothetical protein n=1 Tax=Zavarzinella formosa TaxID=360055 RepID=UPI0002ECA48B|nr:hypothetical protein [Zavarzinella formosa]